MHSNNDLMDPNWRPTPTERISTSEVESARDNVIFKARLVAQCECYRQDGVKMWHPDLAKALETLDKTIASASSAKE